MSIGINSSVREKIYFKSTPVTGFANLLSLQVLFVMGFMRDAKMKCDMLRGREMEKLLLYILEVLLGLFQMKFGNAFA